MFILWFLFTGNKDYYIAVKLTHRNIYFSQNKLLWVFVSWKMKDKHTWQARQLIITFKHLNYSSEEHAGVVVPSCKIRGADCKHFNAWQFGLSEKILPHHNFTHSYLLDKNHSLLPCLNPNTFKFISPT